MAVPAGYGTAFFLIEGWLAPKEGAPINARVYAFKVGGSAAKPEIVFRRIPTPKPPALTTTADEYALGTQLYGQYCLTCHGVGAITGGVLPDLRKSGRLQDAGLWKRAVVDADLASLGMPRFEKYLSPRDAELVRAYVARQAAMLYEEEAAQEGPSMKTLDAARLRETAVQYTAAWCSEDAGRVAAFFAPTGSLKVNDGAPAVGREAITAVAQGFMTAFPDMQVLMDDLVVRGDEAVYKWTLVGTNTGPGGTGRKVRISGYEEWRLGPDALIAESKGHFDSEDWKRQLETGEKAP